MQQANGLDKVNYFKGLSDTFGGLVKLHNILGLVSSKLRNMSRCSDCVIELSTVNL